MVKKRKGIGYIIEAITALMILFIFVSGNTPTEPETNWNTFQKEIMGQDLTLVMEKTGDIDDVIRNGETGTLVTAAETLSRDQLSVSGTVENVPISTQLVGFHVLEGDQENVTLDTVQDLNDQCYQDDDLEEIEPEDGEILRSDNSRDGAYLYVADTDPDISGGDGDVNHDSLWVDNGTRCQFSASEGPYYIDEFFYWGDGPGEEHYDINEIYSPDEHLELFLASQVVDLKPSLESRMNGIDTGIIVDTLDARRHDLGTYDILIFRERQAIEVSNSVLNAERERVQDFLSQGSILLMMNLKKGDFYSGVSTTAIDSYLTSFEGNDPEWSCYTPDQSPSTCTTDSTDYATDGGESLKAAKGDGLCGYGGMTYDFNQNYDTLSLDTKVNTDSWGGAAVMIENSTGVYDLKEWKGGGSSLSEGWTSYNFDVSNAGDDFKLIIGNHDTSSTYCDYSDHGWTIWADDINISKDVNGDLSASSFLTDTGMKWVDLGYRTDPADPVEGRFGRNSDSKKLETYFKGEVGDLSQIDLKPSGNVTSSNNRYFKNSEPLLSTGTGSYDRSNWNATNYNMQQVDPDSVDGYPDTACVDSSKSTSLTQGEFKFHEYESDSFNTYDVINTELGESETYCNKEDTRALSIKLDGDDDYNGENEGPYLNGETLVVEGKKYTVNFPSEEALETGEAAEFIYTGENDIESINYRTSFEGFSGRKLARMGYKTGYNAEEKKMISSVIHWLSEDTVQFGARKDSRISTEAVGGVKENTFIPYKIIMRWR